MRYARALLELPETDRLYGELNKLHALALQALDEDTRLARVAQAHTVWTLKAWKLLLR